MVPQVLTAILFAAILFAAYLYFKNQMSAVKYTEPTIVEDFEVPAPAPIITQPLPEPPRTITPGGANTPNQAPPKEEFPPQRLPGPIDSDPYDETYGSSDMKDNMRYPEKLFGQAIKPNNTELAVKAGTASDLVQGVSSAFQTFSPEFAQNGGEFVGGGVFANDTFEKPNYSAF